MKKYFVVLILTTALWSCKQRNEPVVNLVQAANGLEFVEQATLAPEGSVKLKLDNNTGFYQRSMSVTMLEGRSVLSFINRLNNTIYMYDMGNGELIKRIGLALEGPDGVGQLGVADHVITPDGELLIYNINTGILHKVSQEGKTIRKYSLFDIKGETELSYPNPDNDRKMVLAGDVLHIPSEILVRKDDYSKTASLLSVNLSTGEYSYSLNFPETYNAAYWGAIFKHEPSVAYDQDNGKLMASYPVDPKVYEVSPEGQLENGVYLGSKFIDNLSPMTSDIKYGMRLDPNKRDQRSYEYSLTSSDYSCIKYDGHQGVYYRFVANRPGLARFQEGDKSPEYSIIVADKNLEKLGEARFDKGKYFTSMAVVTADGLAIPRRDLYGQNENELVFDLFKLKMTQNALAVSY